MQEWTSNVPVMALKTHHGQARGGTSCKVEVQFITSSVWAGAVLTVN